MQDLKGKVAVVTGAGSGIGAGIARVAAAAGMKVVLSGRRTDPLEAAAERIGPAASVAGLDVSDKDAVADVASRILADHGRIDVLVNAAGGWRGGKPVHETPLDTLDFLLNLNTRSVFISSRAVTLAIEKAREHGLGMVVARNSTHYGFVAYYPLMAWISWVPNLLFAVAD